MSIESIFHSVKKKTFKSAHGTKFDTSHLRLSQDALHCRPEGVSSRRLMLKGPAAHHRPGAAARQMHASTTFHYTVLLLLQLLDE